MPSLELCFGLIVFGIFVLIWAAIGHGLWVLAATILRAVFGNSRPPATHIRPTSTSDREAAIRHIARLAEQGAIAPVDARHVMEQLQLVPRAFSTPVDAEIVELEAADATPQLVNNELRADEPPPAAAIRDPRQEVLVLSDRAPHTAPSYGSPFAEVGPPLPDPTSPLASSAPPPQLSPLRPSRTLAEMLQAFLEEKNIRWGEILAGLFIVISAVGLIISLRNTLKAIPYFPALMFMVFTVLFHGAGLYSLKKWKLHAVSRVVLIISLLLVSLSFGAGIMLSGSGEARRPLGDPYVIAAIAVAITAFSWVTWSAAKELVRGAAWQIFVIVMGTSIGQVVINRWPVEEPSGGSLMALFALPLVSFLVPLGTLIAFESRSQRLSPRRASRLLLVCGVGLFSLLVPLALLLWMTDDKRGAWADLSPLLSLATGGALAAGLLLYRKTTSRKLAVWQTAGASIAILAVIVLLVLLAVAWPRPALLTAVGLIDGAALVLLARVLGFPLLYAGGVAALTIAWLVGFHWWRGALPDGDQTTSWTMLRALLEIPGPVALLVWNALVATGAAMLRRPDRRASRVLLASAGGVAALTLGITIHAAFAPWMPDNTWPQAASAIFVVYAVALLAGTRLFPHPALPALAAAVWWLALVHVLTFDPVVRERLAPLAEQLHLLRFPTAIHALTTALVALVFARGTLSLSEESFERRSSRRRWLVYMLPLVIAAVAASIVAAVFAFVPWNDAYDQRAINLGAIAVTWLMLGLVTRQPIAVAAAQLAVHASAAMVIAGRWFTSAEASSLPFVEEGPWFLDGSHLVAQVAAAAALAMVWTILRLATERSAVAMRLLRADWPAVDEVIIPAASIALASVLAIGLGPAIGGEFGWTNTDVSDGANGWTRLAYDPLAWTTLILLTSGFALRLWERFDVNALAGLLIVAANVPLLAAGAVVDDLAAATAIRWGLALFVLVATAFVAARESLLAWARRVPRWREARLSRFDVERLRYLALALGGGTILALTCTAVGTSLAGTELAGPMEESFFGRMGLNVSYGVPLLAVVASLVVFSVREKQAGFALAGAGVFQGAVNLALLLYLKDANFTDLREAAALSLQVNAIGCAGYALLWLGLERWIVPDFEQRAGIPRLIDIPLSLLTCLSIIIALWAAAAIVVSPSVIAPWDPRLASWPSFLALALNAAALAWRYNTRLPVFLSQAVLLLVLCTVALAALAVDAIAPWRGFLVLETALAAIGALVTVLAWLWPKRMPASQSVLISLSAAALAVYGGWDSPYGPWYPLAIIAATQFCFAAQGIFLRTQQVAYLAALLAVATGLVIVGHPLLPQLHKLPQAFLHVLGIPGLSLAGISLVWLGVEVWFQRQRGERLAGQSRLLPMHQAAAWLLVVGVFLIVSIAWVLRLLPDWDSALLLIVRTETVAFAASIGLLLLGLLWDRHSRAIPLLYVWGIAATALMIVAIDPPLKWGFVSLLVATAAYVAITSHLWKWGADLAGWGLRLGIYDPVEGLVHTSRWLPWMNIVASLGLAAATVIAVLNLPLREMRMAASITPLLLAWCASSLAQERRKEALLVATYLLGALAAACLGWADLAPDQTAVTWLVRTVRLLMALSFATLLYGLVVPRWILAFGDWHVAARRAAGLTGTLALVTLLVVLGQELVLFVPRVGAPIDNAQLIAVSVVLVGLVVGLFSLALLPGRDPLSLSEEGRMYYVYAGEMTAALLFAHLYMARPGLFDHTLRPYWPYIIVALAFAAVGLSELFQRSGIHVLSQPLERTGGLLPLLPALGMWFLASRTEYSAVLFAIGLIYLLHSWLRQSFTTGMAAALAGNGALWSWLAKDPDRSFFEHPQLWLIPPALSVLLAAHLQRKRLESGVLIAIRYAATLVIYLSSTSEMFIVGIGHSLWPPMVLALLGTAGAFAGMLLQIRAFLYLGTGFVLLALVSMVAHAARAIDHVWPWWAFGIGVGLAILVLFGIFEKKRTEVMSLIERLRHWEN